MVAEVKIYNKLEDVLKEIPRDKEKELIEEMKDSKFIDKLCKNLSSTIYGKRKDYSYDACRLIISAFAPRIPIVDPETKSVRFVRGVEAHIIEGEPSSGKSSWENILRSQGINVIFSQIMTEGGIVGTPYMNGLVRNLKNTVWIIPEGERSLSSFNVVNTLRSLIEEQEITKISAMAIPSYKDISIQSSVLINLVEIPSTSKEYQLLSRLHRIKFEYEHWGEVKDIGRQLGNSLLLKLENNDGDFTPQPKHYFALLGSKVLELRQCILPENLRKDLISAWNDFIDKIYSDNNIPKGIALRDLTEGFRCAQNNGLLNYYQRKTDSDVLELTEDDEKKGIEFMERVMKSRVEYQEEEMRDSRRGTKFNHIQLAKAIKMVREKKNLKEINKATGISIGSLSRFRSDWMRGKLL